MLNQDFKEFVQSLNDNQVRYLIVGGYAVAIYGYARYTKDLDIWIEMTRENANNVLRALDQFGFGSLNLTVEDFTTPDQVIQFGYPPNRIDIITTPDGVDFSTCFDTKYQVEVDGVLVNFIDLENLKQNKKASGRMQDLADLEKLEDRD